MSEGRRLKLIVLSLCLIAAAGMVAAVVAHRQIGLWTGSKGVVVAHAGENWLELIRLIGPAVSCGALYLAWRTTARRATKTISDNLELD
jgi:hypothetical protein